MYFFVDFSQPFAEFRLKMVLDAIVTSLIEEEHTFPGAYWQ